VSQEVRIPDIGDIEQVEVIEICVAPGDSVGPDDALIVIESDKASMEVPAGMSGTIVSVAVALGDQVAEGALVVTVEPAVVPGEDDTEPKGTPASVPKVTPEPESERALEPESVPSAPVDTTASLPEKAPEAAATKVEVRVPDIGEATNVEVIEVGVLTGAAVAADDLLVVVESDKASMEIPAGHAGSVVSVHVEVGSQVEEGTLLAIIATVPSEGEVVPTAPLADNAGDMTATSVPSSESESTTAAIVEAPSSKPPVASREDETSAPRDGGRRVYAGPAVRRLSRELGVALGSVKGTGNRGRILKDDVKSFVKSAMTSAAKTESGGAGIPGIPAVDFSRFGPVVTEPLSKIRAAGARNLHRSWLNLPHVTQFEEADVTELETFRATLKEEAVRREVKITPLAFIVKACCYALQAFPTFNASLDPEVKNFVLKKYYHIGFAVDTPDGLVVPVIKDADKMGVWDLSVAIADLAEKARTQTLGMGDIQGGTFSISSLGGIGGTGFTPIINAPEVAILGVSRLVTKPMWDGADFVPRQMLPLSLSYDHRAINGAEAGRFMAMLAELLGDIRRLSL
jgi:pyruvate dehydrogenase E2 component (dihydrolipoamide acetyltransferase)